MYVLDFCLLPRLKSTKRIEAVCLRNTKRIEAVCLRNTKRIEAVCLRNTKRIEAVCMFEISVCRLGKGALFCGL